VQTSPCIFLDFILDINLKIKQDIHIGNNIRVSELIALAELFQTDYNSFFIDI